MTEELYYDETEYPNDYDELPELPVLLDTLSWDVVCIFDACRWDAFTALCDEVCEPVSTPAAHTWEWVDTVWTDGSYDWSDVTYISGNPVTSTIEHSDTFTGDLNAHVGEYIEAFKDAGGAIPITSPKPVLDAAERADPPMVLHFLQPHNPFVGDLSLGVSKSFDTMPTDLVGGEKEITEIEKHSREVQLVKQGHISVELYRLAYLENLKKIWNDTDDVRQRYEKVITTADHGEALGPDEFGHGGNTNHGHTVPFHTTWDVDLPAPDSAGATAGYDWIHQ